MQEPSKSSVLKVENVSRKGLTSQYKLSNGTTLTRNVVSRELTIEGTSNSNVELPVFGDPQADFNFLYSISGQYREYEPSKWSNDGLLYSTKYDRMQKSKLYWFITKVCLVISVLGIITLFRYNDVMWLVNKILS